METCVKRKFFFNSILAGFTVFGIIVIVILLHKKYITATFVISMFLTLFYFCRTQIMKILVKACITKSFQPIAHSTRYFKRKIHVQAKMYIQFASYQVQEK